MTVQSPQDLFFYELCAMYDAEQKLVQVLPKLAQECPQAQVKEAFLQHERETRQHVSNLAQCIQLLGRSPMPLENHAIAGLKQDHDAFQREQPSQEALTMYDLKAGCASEYLEMSAYRGLIDAANGLGLQKCIPLLQQNLQQEEAAAKKLETLAHQLGQQQAGSMRP